MKPKHLLLAFLLIPAILSSKTLTKSEMKTLGTLAFQQKAQAMCPEAAGFSLKGCEFIADGSSLYMAVLHFEHGFLVLSAEDAVMPVLAYDFSNDINLGDMSPATERLLQQYREEIDAVRRLQLPPTERVQNAWDALRHPSRATTAETVVAPLLTSAWNQNKYYNYYSPKDENSPAGYDGKTPNGCVAIAMSQIIYYYRFPETGSSSHTNYTYEYGSFHVNFAEQHYHYEAMTDQLSYYNEEVAKLIFHCATAVDMQYGADGSGAYSQSVPTAMSTYFKYSFDAQHESKHQFSDAAWHSKLKEDLDVRRPVYYSGYSEEGGHAFVCDGYDSDDYFHFNFGWGGQGNGFYLTESSDDSAVNGYSGWQSAIFDLHPRNDLYPSYCSDRVLTAVNGTLEDGSGIFEYQNNSNCTYLITHPNQYTVNVTLQYLFSEEGHDYLRFWNGNPAKDSLLLELSGTKGNTNYSFNTDSLYITFETDDSATAQGWRLSYQSNRDGIGCGTYSTHETSGIISDKSEENNYRDNSNCTWMIRLSNVPSVTFFFDELDISPEDHLDFYNLASSPNELLASYSGNSLPEPLTLNISKIRVHFVSDNYLNAQGFKVRWSTSQAGIEEFCTSTNVYPNPAADVLHVVLGEMLDECHVSLFDAVGNAVYAQAFSLADRMDIPVQHLPNGIYVMHLESQGRTMHQKIVISH